MATTPQIQPTGAESSAGPSRRRFLGWLAAGAAFVLVPSAARPTEPRCPEGGSAPGNHPDPRPGITGDKVLTAEQLNGAADLIVIFNGVREMPHIADGLRCYCGCADVPGYRSLLSCYEGVGMAQHCMVCQGQARLAHKRFKEGQSLDQIRRAIDARYGDG